MALPSAHYPKREVDCRVRRRMRSVLNTRSCIPNDQLLSERNSGIHNGRNGKAPCWHFRLFRCDATIRRHAEMEIWSAAFSHTMGWHPTKVERPKTCNSISFFRGTFLPLKELLLVLPQNPWCLKCHRIKTRTISRASKAVSRAVAASKSPISRISSLARSRARVDNKAVNRADSRTDNQSLPLSAPSTSAGGFLMCLIR